MSTDKKFRLLCSFCVFVCAACIILTASQSAYLGLFAGFGLFFLLYPKKPKLLKIALAVLIISLAVFSVSAKLFPETIGNIMPAITSWGIDQNRLSSWKIGVEAIKHKPLFGYGPENFQTAFEKYYDPSLPQMTSQKFLHSSWWDKAHNFLIQTTVDFGLIGLIFHLLFFGFLFLFLEKAKQKAIKEKNGPDPRLFLLMQSSFAAYFANTFFNFDTQASLISISFLTGYSFCLLKTAFNQNFQIVHNYVYGKGNKNNLGSPLAKKLILFLGLALLFAFLKISALVPFSVIAKTNVARNEIESGNYKTAIELTRKAAEINTVFDSSYLGLEYADILKECASQMPEQETALIYESYEIMKKKIPADSKYIKNWLALSQFASYLANYEKDSAKKEELAKESSSYIEKAKQLSPKRQENFIEETRLNWAVKNYSKAIDSANNCLALNSNSGECLWMLAVSYAFNNDTESFQRVFYKSEKDQKTGAKIINNLIASFLTDSPDSTKGLTGFFLEKNDYLSLEEFYRSLILIGTFNEDSHYRSQLAVIYKELGKYEEARKEALWVLELDPASKEEVEAFLKTLPNK
jgi:Flp pilus assembly protein TadD